MKKFKFNKISIFVLALALVFSDANLVKAATAVSLGTADSFAVLAGSGITNTDATTITGDVGSFPTTTQTGFGTVTINGTNHAGDATTQSAKTDLVTAYGAAGQANSGVNGGVVTSDLGTFNGGTLTPGVYEENDAPNSLSITGTLTLDGGGDPNAVFIFKSGSTLTTASSSVVNLINGTQACNVFWQVGSSATLGTGSNFKGNILAMDSITDDGGSTITGRLLARNALVTLNNTTVTRTPCAATSQGSQSGSINVVKTVVNDGGGTSTVASFPLFVNGVSVTSGTTNLFSAPGRYIISETSNAQYIQTFSGDCDATGGLNLNPGFATFCIITNNDIAAPAIPPVPPLIDVVKVASPLNLPLGPGPVTYTYTTRNIGTVPMTNVTMVGDTCSPIVLQSGDTNSDGRLDVTETWVYTCPTTLSATHTNTVVATGWANGISAVDIASATVVVGTPLVPPLIHVTKIPSPLALSAAGGMVTYTNKVTNPGTVALSNVRLTDNKCSPVNYISGDMNLNSQLDVSETWTYICQSNLASTTTNTVVAQGDANGFTARDFAIATVVVAAPGFPRTGLSASSSFDFGQQVRTIAISLRQGGRGNNVSILQEFLISQNKGPKAEALARVGATAYFGSMTRAALAEFQASVGIYPPLGNFGPITRAYLSAHY
ncbi:MAG: ice-binding family protein [Candidatus Paceibacterota bacterium]|jgi:uncharacterized repeat protein (TIGR01451 family)